MHLPKFALAVALSVVSLLAKGQDSIRILSWNIKMLPSVAETGGKAKRAKAIVKELRSRPQDVIVLQEAFHKRSRRIVAKGLADLYPYRTPVLNKRFISLKFNGGVIILSKHPIREVHEIRYKERTGFDRMARKGALLAEVDINGKRIQVAGTHLQAFGAQEIMYSQYHQLSDQLLKPTQKDGVPQFVCGDFNTIKTIPPQLPAGISQSFVDRLPRYQYLLQTLQATDGDLSGDQQFTMDRPYNDLCERRKEYRLLLDYIFLIPNGTSSLLVRRQVQIIRNQWHEEHKDLSDHFAVEAIVSGF